MHNNKSACELRSAISHIRGVPKGLAAVCTRYNAVDSECQQRETLQGLYVDCTKAAPQCILRRFARNPVRVNMDYHGTRHTQSRMLSTLLHLSDCTQSRLDYFRRVSHLSLTPPKEKYYSIVVYIKPLI